jgi:ubiquinone/menaquinone biosynthesis C-methylase UbiE
MSDQGSTGPEFNSEYFACVYRDYEAQNPPRKLAFYRSVIESSLLTGRSHRLLDIGCGLGSFLQHMQITHPEWELMGSDVSSYAIEQNSARMPGIRFVVASATEEAADPSSVNVVTAFDVIEHVSNRNEVAAAVRRVLAPGGLFVMVVPVYDGPTGLLVRALDRDPTHIHKLSRWDWLAWIDQSFQLLDWWGIVRFLLPGQRYLHVPTQLVRRWTPAILVTARQP